MSSALRSLRTQANELERFYQDLKRCESDPLEGAVAADRSVGRGVKVTHWVLIEHFLINLVEWNYLYTNYLRYYGQTDDSNAISKRRWDQLKACNEMAREIIVRQEYSGLPERLRSSWISNDERLEPTFDEHSDGVADPAALFHEVVNCDLRNRTASVESWQGPGMSSFAEESVVPPNRGWQTLAQTLEEKREQLYSRLIDAGPDPLNEVRYFLQNYRHATLRLSWLEEQLSTEKRSFLFALNRDPTQEQMSINRFLDEVREATKGNAVAVTERVLMRILATISEIGYANFVDDVTAPDFVGGQDSPLGSSDVNVIPGEGSSKCCSVLVATSRGSGRRGKLGFPKVLQQVKAHLTECAGITLAVIILCDTWDSRSFMNDHFDELRAHHRKGVRFLFLMTGAPNTSIAPVEIRF